MTQRKHTPIYTAEFRERGIRLFRENRSNYSSDNAAYRAIASQLGCSPDSLRAWSPQTERGKVYVTPQEAEEAFYANMNNLDKVA